MKINSNNKGQASIELLLILVFLFTVITIIIYYSGTISVGLKKQQSMNEMNNYAESFLKEFEIFVKVNEGYHRELEIPDFIFQNYNLTIKNQFLVLRNLKYSENQSPYLFYEIPGGVTPILEIRNIGGVDTTFLVIKREDFDESGDYLDLS